MTRLDDFFVHDLHFSLLVLSLMMMMLLLLSTRWLLSLSSLPLSLSSYPS